MKDRIQIDGVWYVKEDNTPKIKVELNPVESHVRTYESDKYCFTINRMKDREGGFYDDIDIEFTNKRPNWTEDNWDNNSWFVGVLEGNTESIDEARLVLDEQGIEEFRAILADLAKIGWLKTK